MECQHLPCGYSPDNKISYVFIDLDFTVYKWKSKSFINPLLDILMHL